MESQYNIKSPAVKRLMREAEELRQSTAEFYAQPLEDNLFEWHFTVRGPPDSDFSTGYYHGRIILPTEYPMKPPSIIMLTPNGRFEVNKKICLSISGHHPESWQPSWSIRTALLAIIGFMPTEGMGAIGSLDYPPLERKKLAVKSKDWCCPSCGVLHELLKEKTVATQEMSDADKEAKELAKQICFKGAPSSSTSESQPSSSTSASNDDQSNEDKLTASHVDESSFSNQESNDLRQRNVLDTHSRPETQSYSPPSQSHPSNVSQQQHQQVTANLSSSLCSNRIMNYLIVAIVGTIAGLILRRLFYV